MVVTNLNTVKGYDKIAGNKSIVNNTFDVPVSGDNVGNGLRGTNKLNMLPSSMKEANDKAKKDFEKSYSDPKKRPSYAKGPDGKVFDPYTFEEITWDKSKVRKGQWDMGYGIWDTDMVRSIKIYTMII